MGCCICGFISYIEEESCVIHKWELRIFETIDEISSSLYQTINKEVVPTKEVVMQQTSSLYQIIILKGYIISSFDTNKYISFQVPVT